MQKIIYRCVCDLKTYENNPRDIEKAISPVAESIKQFGFLVPILVDKNDIIIAGHTRKAAAERLNLEKVPCIVADELTEEQIKAFRLVDNKTNEFSEWEFIKLMDELEEIADIDLSTFDFPSLEEMNLDITDEDFLKDTEIVKDRSPKTITCPNCGEIIDL